MDKIKLEEDEQLKNVFFLYYIILSKDFFIIIF